MSPYGRDIAQVSANMRRCEYLKYTRHEQRSTDVPGHDLHNVGLGIHGLEQRHPWSRQMLWISVGVLGVPLLV